MSLVNKKYFTIYLFYFYFYFLKIFMRNYLPFLKGYKSISTYFSSSFLFKPNKGKIICSKKKKNSILSLLSLTKNTKRKPPSNVPKNPKIDNYSVSFFFFQLYLLKIHETIKGSFFPSIYSFEAQNRIHNLHLYHFCKNSM